MNDVANDTIKINFDQNEVRLRLTDVQTFQKVDCPDTAATGATCHFVQVWVIVILRTTDPDGLAKEIQSKIQDSVDRGLLQCELQSLDPSSFTSRIVVENGGGCVGTDGLGIGGLFGDPEPELMAPIEDVVDTPNSSSDSDSATTIEVDPEESAPSSLGIAGDLFSTTTTESDTPRDPAASRTATIHRANPLLRKKTAGFRQSDWTSENILETIRARSGKLRRWLQTKM